ncbi:nicotinate-nucleotide adenylyltransferase [Oceanisphaera avium]|uniref:Probable nicotinate-nucleotide adenylyltransferase n=1 Tax=Oceanisphaera avium TaxID=1903694 RepID=A0A1Y0CY38_9GAMM|nr:nicotinate-nucleotide adenylyltransferase [Oceanisphaera avium]ART79817.1 nicotinic acid mononucleotide adenylyltransferase [Oceanisphaera avium]
MMKNAIGLLGGTFDPIHVGHLRPAIAMLEQLGLSEVRLIPNYIPPHKATPDSDANHRLNMAKLAAAATPGLVVDARELNRNRPSYTLDTLKELRGEHPTRALCFIMGMDSLCSLDKWHGWQELLNYAHLVVGHRPGWQPQFNTTLHDFIQRHLTDDASLLSSKTQGHIYLFNNPQLDISSSQIRHCLQAGNNPQYLLPEGVLNYIRDKGLYQLHVL